MNTPTYQQQYDKVIDAYFKNQLQPMHPNFCFCGTLNKEWCGWNSDNSYYSKENFFDMEKALLTPLIPFGATPTFKFDFKEPGSWAGAIKIYNEEYEEALFDGMCKALDVLREIHIKKGEVIDTPPQFQKRKLQKQLNLQP